MDTPPLEYDTDLEKEAQRYADELMKKYLGACSKLTRDIWVHDPKNEESGWGENLYFGLGQEFVNNTAFCAKADKAW